MLSRQIPEIINFVGSYNAIINKRKLIEMVEPVPKKKVTTAEFSAKFRSKYEVY